MDKHLHVVTRNQRYQYCHHRAVCATDDTVYWLPREVAESLADYLTGRVFPVLADPPSFCEDLRAEWAQLISVGPVPSIVLVRHQDTVEII